MEINTSNCHFFWTSRRLRELQHSFGEKGHRAPHPFCSAISREKLIPQFQMGLLGPTRTSAVMHIDVNFAVEKGTLIVLNNPVCESKYVFDPTAGNTMTSLLLYTASCAVFPRKVGTRDSRVDLQCD